LPEGRRFVVFVFASLGIVGGDFCRSVSLVTFQKSIPRYNLGLNRMLPYVFTRAVVRGLDWLAARSLAPDPRPPHQQTGSRGEEDAYFHLRKRGYAMVARNFRTPRCRGEIDLIGWDGDILCFIEVKTRSSRQVKSAEAAVDRHKRREVMEVAREYLRRAPPSCQWRFDIVSVYYDGLTASPDIEVFKNASLSN
jgi:putative endonuclease